MTLNSSRTSLYCYGQNAGVCFCSAVITGNREIMPGRQLWMAAVLLASRVTAQLVDMNNSSLTNIPTNQTPNLTTFFLSHNSIVMSTLDIKTLQKYFRLRVLDLSNNLIQTLPPGAFNNLTNLEILKLRQNRLRSLPEDIFKKLTKLKTLDLEDNPWTCSCSLVTLIKQLNDSGISVGRDVTCYYQEKPRVLDGESSCSFQSTKTAKTIPKALLITESTNSIYVNDSSKEFTGSGAGMSTGSNSWKFLLGVVVITLSTSMLIVCAVKSPSWYKLLFNYRHQRLREDAGLNVINTGRYSNFSLDTEQTETSVQEPDENTEHRLSMQSLEDDDGYIEDGYIESGHYRDQTNVIELLE